MLKIIKPRNYSETRHITFERMEAELGRNKQFEEEDKGEGITTDYILDNAQHKHWTAWALLDLQKDGKIIQIKPNVWKVVK